MKITALTIRSHADGKSVIDVDCELYNQTDVDALA
jgi:hypothetical protein